MLPLLKPRLPPKPYDALDAEMDFSVFKHFFFFAASFSNFFQGLGFFLPFIYLPCMSPHPFHRASPSLTPHHPANAIDISLTHTQSALLLSLLSVSQIAGQIGMGYLSDNHNIHIPLFLSPFFSALSIFLLWGFAKSLGPLLVFSILYGMFAGGYSVLYCRFVTNLTSTSSEMSQRATGLWLYSIFEFQRGVGNIIGGVVSGLLVTGPVKDFGYGVGRYEWLVLLVGGSMLVSSLGGLGNFLRAEKF